MTQSFAPWQDRPERPLKITPEALEVHRQALFGHCYRMLASPTDAEDAVREAMVEPAPDAMALPPSDDLAE